MSPLGLLPLLQFFPLLVVPCLHDEGDIFILAAIKHSPTAYLLLKSISPVHLPDAVNCAPHNLVSSSQEISPFYPQVFLQFGPYGVTLVEVETGHCKNKEIKLKLN